MENFHKNQPKSLESCIFFITIKFMFTDINIYPINDKTEPDPLFHETDPRIRIHVKMKRIRNTGVNKKKFYADHGHQFQNAH